MCPRIGSGSASGTPASFSMDLTGASPYASSEFDSESGSVDLVSQSDTSSHPSLSPVGIVPVPLPALYVSPPSQAGQSPEEYTRSHFAAFDSADNNRPSEHASSSSQSHQRAPQAFSFSSSYGGGDYPSTSTFALPSYPASYRPNPADFYHPRSYDSYPTAGPSSSSASAQKPTPRTQLSLPVDLHRHRHHRQQHHNVSASTPTPRTLMPSYLAPPPLPPEPLATEDEPESLGAYYLHAFRMETENGLPSPFMRRRAQTTTSAVMNYRPGETTAHEPVAMQMESNGGVAETSTPDQGKPFALHLGGGLHRRRASHHEDRLNGARWLSFS